MKALVILVSILLLLNSGLIIFIYETINVLPEFIMISAGISFAISGTILFVMFINELTKSL
jgi:hypothetical protein